MAPDYYMLADKICTELERTGFAEEAKTVKSSIAASATGTEALMSIRFNLTTALKNNPEIQPELKASIESLISQINRSLS